MVSSTQDIAAARAMEGAPEGTVVVAAAQTAGRGRFGRRWESPAGGLYLTAILRPATSASRLGEIALVGGLALAEAVETFGLRAEVKWPNDVLIGGRKAGGILCEAAAALLVGVGVNCGDAPLAGAAGLGGRVAPDALLEPFLLAFGGRYAEWTAGGLAPLLPSLEGRLVLRKERVRFRDGAVEGEGVVRGLAADGGLRLSLGDDERVLRAGEIVPYTP